MFARYWSIDYACGYLSTSYAKCLVLSHARMILVDALDGVLLLVDTLRPMAMVMVRTAREFSVRDLFSLFISTLDG